MDSLAAVGIRLSIGAVDFGCGNWAGASQSSRQHALVANNDRPRWKTLELHKEVVTRLSISMREAGFGTLSAQSSADRLAAIVLLRIWRLGRSDGGRSLLHLDVALSCGGILCLGRVYGGSVSVRW